MKYTNKFKDKNVMITGGLGFVGSNLAHKLVDLKANVMLVDSLIPDYGGNLFNIYNIKNKVKVNITDIRSEHSMRYLVKNQDYIFNIAGQVSHIDSMKDPFADLDINCRSQISLLEACRNNNNNVKIIFASTRQVYGKAEYLPIDEKHILQPTDFNGINKMAGERYHILYNNVYGIRTCSLRMTNTFGPRQLMKHNRQGFIPWFIRQVVDNEEIKVFGTGEQLRDVNYIADVVEAFLLAAASEKTNGQVYNLGHHKPISLKELVETMIKINGKGKYKIVPFPDDKAKIDVGSAYCTYFKIKKELGWEPKVSITEGIRRTLTYCKKYKQYYW